MSHVATRTVHLDGKKYLAGEAVKVDGKQAAELLAVGAIQPGKPAEQKPADGKAP